VNRRATDVGGPDDDAEDGLAAERTALAWGRSTMALFACGAAVAKGIPNVTGAGRPGLGLAVLALGVAVWLCGLPFARARRAELDARRPVRAHELAPLAYGTALVGIAALMIAAFFPG